MYCILSWVCIFSISAFLELENQACNTMPRLYSRLVTILFDHFLLNNTTNSFKDKRMFLFVDHRIFDGDSLRCLKIIFNLNYFYFIYFYFSITFSFSLHTNHSSPFLLSSHAPPTSLLTLHPFF